MKAMLESGGGRFASLWKIARTDGTTLYFTSHTQSIDYLSNTYQPMSVGGQSARRAQSGLRERNLEFVGYLSSGEIEDDDLRTGAYNGAEVTEYVIDWAYPWQGSFDSNTYYITEISWTGEEWEGQINGLTTQLRQAKGRVIGRRCEWVLGDADCGVDVASHTDSGSVSSVPEQRKRIYTNLTGEVGGYYDNGELTFTSGSNNGRTIDVEQYIPTNGEFIFALPVNFDIAASDTFDVYPGCGGDLEDCKGTSGSNNRPWATNVANHGGFPHVPGTTTSLLTPNAK